MRQAMWMHNKRLTAQSFRRWKAVYSESLNMKNKTNLALWHWCLNLQHKVCIMVCVFMCVCVCVCACMHDVDINNWYLVIFEDNRTCPSEYTPSGTSIIEVTQNKYCPFVGM